MCAAKRIPRLIVIREFNWPSMGRHVMASPSVKQRRYSPVSNSSTENEEGTIPGSEVGEDEGIGGLKPQKSHRTSKRKIRATTTSKFGATLEHLLNTDAPSSLPLSLQPSVARKRTDEKLELQAKKILERERKDKEDKARMRDVIGGWGGESERALRKVAQRGVVRLFNVIHRSQASAAEQATNHQGTRRLTSPAPSTHAKRKQKSSNKDNIIGRGKESTVTKDDFFNMIKAGVVSKA